MSLSQIGTRKSHWADCLGRLARPRLNEVNLRSGVWEDLPITL